MEQWDSRQCSPFENYGGCFKFNRGKSLKRSAGSRPGGLYGRGRGVHAARTGTTSNIGVNRCQ